VLLNKKADRTLLHSVDKSVFSHPVIQLSAATNFQDDVFTFQHFDSYEGRIKSFLEIMRIVFSNQSLFHGKFQFAESIFFGN